MEIKVSAPGKVILHGEHAVVYGKAAIAGSLDLRCHLTLTETSDSRVHLDLPDIGVSQQMLVSSLQKNCQTLLASDPASTNNPVPASEEVISALKKFLGFTEENTDTKQLAVLAFVYIYSSIFMSRREPPSLTIQIISDIPVGAGLGSSAAFSVALSAALLEFAGIISSEKTSDGIAVWSPTDLDTINRWAFIGEKLIHGRPSGIDNSISTYGGALRFKEGKMAHIDGIPTLSIMLVNTQVPRSTKTLVAGFRKKYDTYTSVFDPILAAVEAITEKAEATLKSMQQTSNSGDFTTLEDLMDTNHQLLNVMGVGHPSLDQIVSLAHSNDLHGKLTGAGGGGCAIILLPPRVDDGKVETLKEKFTSMGFQVWSKVSFGGKGVLRLL